ncbi:MAG: flavodoxin family protein [Eubacterium sp.]|nr:flavodoxin family protein [Eubacterium sp.]
MKQKKIVVFNGSPRIHGNTAKLVEAFEKGAKEAGHQVTVFDLTKRQIHPCLGCMQGGKNSEFPCVQRDGMTEIYPAFDEADVMVWASPLYYWGISGQLKCTIDRLFALAERDKREGRKGAMAREIALLMTADGNAFEDVEVWFDGLKDRSVQWKSVGKVLCGNLHGSDNMEGRPEIQQAYELGKNI